MLENSALYWHLVDLIWISSSLPLPDNLSEK